MRLRPNIEALKWIFSQKITDSNDEFYQAEILIEVNGNAPIRIESKAWGNLWGRVEKNNQNSFEEDISSAEEECLFF